jgi:hypothetical protein
MPKQPHPAQALLDEQQELDRWDRQIWLEKRARALLLERELRQIRNATRSTKP